MINTPKNLPTRVTNSEALFTITSAAAGAFFNQTASLIPAAFPWLNPVASNYSKFRWVRLRLVYIPAIATNVSGSVVLGMNYDTQDSPPTSLVQAQSANLSVSAPAWAGSGGASSLHGFPPLRGDAIAIDVDVTKFGSGDKLTYYRYMGGAAYNALTAADKNIYCPAMISVSTGGGPTTSVQFGTLFASYVVELIEPIYASLNV